MLGRGNSGVGGLGRSRRRTGYAAETDYETGDTPRLILVQNWFEELKAKVGR